MEATGIVFGKSVKDLYRKEDKKILMSGNSWTGVVTGWIIARNLSCEFGLVISRKLRAAHNEELARDQAVGENLQAGLVISEEMYLLLFRSLKKRYRY